MKLIGILNTTPDSFADAGLHLDPAWAVSAGLRMAREGAAILDVGGESTRPGSVSVPPDEQVRRTLPVIDALARALPRDGMGHVALSIDTTSSVVARAALDAGATIINDTSAGRDDPDVFALAARRGAGLILMHRELPASRDRFSDAYAPHAPSPIAGDVVAHVLAFLKDRIDAAVSAGVARSSLVIDPGLGFGKTVEQNLSLIRATPRFVELGIPVLSALSRKSFVGRVGLERESTPQERLVPTIALSMLHASLGATMLRVHDVAEHAIALRAMRAIWGIAP